MKYHPVQTEYIEAKDAYERLTVEIAFWHWKFNCEEWVAGYDTVDQLPDALRGPYRS